MPVVPSARVAFRCCKCGRLHEAAHAGENTVPHACRVCGSGVAFGFSHAEAMAHPHAASHRAALEGLPEGEIHRHPLKGGRSIIYPFNDIAVHKILVHENWEVLAHASSGRLAELGLTPDQVEEHRPEESGKGNQEPSRLLHVAARDAAGTQDRATSSS